MQRFVLIFFPETHVYPWCLHTHTPLFGLYCKAAWPSNPANILRECP